MHVRRSSDQDVVLVTPDSFHVGFARRVLDVVVASLLLLVSLPFLAVAAVLIRLGDGGPVFYRQERIGEGAAPFSILKLRTMRVSTAGPTVTSTTDDRITRVGRFLRRTAIDELPQLWHVLRGQMTLVGPRPEAAALAAAYPESCRFILAARPGLTGPSQLRYRESSAEPPPGWDVEQWYLTRLVPLRVDADLDYLIDPRLGRTLRYLWLTALFVLGLHTLETTVSVESPVDSSPARPAQAG
jgi:lipopolysaccharide/colanic/teichoic acid biosynthesis glycosyltransferase